MAENFNMIKFIAGLKEFTKDVNNLTGTIDENLVKFKQFMTDKYGKAIGTKFDSYVKSVGNTIERLTPKTVPSADTAAIDTLYGKTGANLSTIGQAIGKEATKRSAEQVIKGVGSALARGTGAVGGTVAKAVFNPLTASVIALNEQLKGRTATDVEMIAMASGWDPSMGYKADGAPDYTKLPKEQQRIYVQRINEFYKKNPQKLSSTATSKTSTQSPAQPVQQQTSIPQPSSILPAAPSIAPSASNESSNNTNSYNQGPNMSVEQFIQQETADKDNPIIYDIKTGKPIGYADGTPITAGKNIAYTDNNGNTVVTGGMSNVDPNNIATSAATPTFNPYVPATKPLMTEEEKQLFDDLTKVEGNLTSQNMVDLLKSKYTEYNQLINEGNPYYQGQVQPTTGYQIDPDTYNRLQHRDDVLNTLSYLRGEAPTSNFAQNYANQQQMAYRNAIANQAGVPYEDYIKGVVDRQTKAIEAKKDEIVNYLKVQASQATDMKERMALFQKIYEVERNAQSEIDKANTTAYGNYQKEDLAQQGAANVANITQQGGLQKQYAANQGSLDVKNVELNNPYYQMGKTGTFLNSFGWLPSGMQQGMITNLNPTLQKGLFGYNPTPEQIGGMFNWQNINQEQQQNRSKFDKFWRHMRGLQADEQ